MDKPKKISEAIRFGMTFLGNSRHQFIDDYNNPKCCCAIGTAYVAAGLPMDFESVSVPNIYSRLSERFAVPLHLLVQASFLHSSRMKTRKQIAAWFAKQGY